MPQPLKTVEQIRVSGNPRNLTSKQLSERAKRFENAPDAPRAGRPRMPKHLSPEAQKVFRETVRLMKRRGILTADCATTLSVFSEVSASWIMAKQDVLTRGQIIEEIRTKKNGETYTVEAVNPSVQIQSEAEKKLLSLTKALGLSPDARQKVKVVKERPENIPAVPGTAAYKYPQFFKGGQNGN